MFLPRAFVFYNRLLRIRIFYLYCMTVLFFLMVVSLWWYFLYQPTVIAADELQRKINQIYANIDELRISERKK